MDAPLQTGKQNAASEMNTFTISETEEIQDPNIFW
jgi:hypothetical protein